MTRGAGQEPGHIAALDGARGLAILLVVWHHAGSSGFPSGTAAAAVREAAGLGWVGVDLFFVLSGMLITGILMDTRDGKGYFRSFYGRRTLRIFPLYYAALALILLVLPLVAGRYLQEPLAPREGNAWLWMYLLNVKVALVNGRDVVHGMLFPFWSLAVEEQFYLAWPLLVWLLPARALGWTSAGLMAAALALRCWMTAAGAHPTGIYALTFTRMDTLAAGALIAIAARHPGGLPRWKRTAAWAAAGSAAGIALVVLAARDTSNMTAPMQTAGFSLVALLFAALLVLLLTAGPAHPLTRIMGTGWLRHVGARSYGLYVWHMVLLWAIIRAGVVPRVLGVGMEGPLYPFAASATLLALSLAAAEVSWRLLEEPVLRLKRFVPRPVARPAVPLEGALSLAPGARPDRKGERQPLVPSR